MREIVDVHAGKTMSCGVTGLPSETNGPRVKDCKTPPNQHVVARVELYHSSIHSFVFQRVAFGLSLVAIASVAIASGLVLHRSLKPQSEFRDITAFLDNDLLNCKDIYSKVKNISSLSFQMTAKNSSQEANPRQFVSYSYGPVSAHFILHEPTSDGESKGSEDHIVTLMRATKTESSISSGHARGVSINTDNAVILISGLYYVYSSIEYNLKNISSPTQWPKEQTTWFHYVHRIGPNNPMNTGVLLRTVYKPCPSCHDSPETKYTGGIFHLRAGDQVKVCLSGHGFVNYDPLSTYFGLILLASKDV